ncbi:hypothetical protein GGI43DRAFT_327009 [Trichoderma evansii]
MQLEPSATRIALPLVSSCIASHRLASSRICLCIALHRLSKVVPSSSRLVHLLVLAAGELRFTACLCLYRQLVLSGGRLQLSPAQLSSLQGFLLMNSAAAAATRLVNTQHYIHQSALLIHPSPRWPHAPDPIARYGPRRRRGMDLFSVLLAPSSPIPRPRDP